MITRPLWICSLRTLPCAVRSMVVHSEPVLAFAGRVPAVLIFSSFTTDESTLGSDCKKHRQSRSLYLMSLGQSQEGVDFLADCAVSHYSLHVYKGSLGCCCCLWRRVTFGETNTVVIRKTIVAASRGRTEGSKGPFEPS